MSKELWIQDAIKHHGALRAMAEKQGKMMNDGTISKSWLHEKASGNGTTARRANLALTLAKLGKALK